MKKSLLAAAIVLGSSAVVMAGAENPMALNQDGIGQVLIYPYYNVNDGFDTHFSVVNTSGTTRAVKVRINEGKNSWEVLDFNLYLSPQDVWAGVLHKYEDGTIRILTSDNSCTLPTIAKAHEVAEFLKAGRQVDNDPALRHFNLELIEAEHADDNGRLHYKIAEAAQYTPAYFTQRASEGYIEVIDMGRVVGNVEEWNKAVNERSLTAGLEHVEDKNGNFVPRDCAVLDLYYNKYWTKKEGPDHGIVSDGENALIGNATLINVGQGLSGGYNAVAVKNFIDKEKLDDNNDPTGRTAPNAYTLHNLPGSSFPNLNGQVERGGKDGDVKYPSTLNTHVQVFDAKQLLGQDKTDTKPTSGIIEIIKDRQNQALRTGDADSKYGLNEVATATALSAVLMTKEVIGEYVVDPTLNAASDWVLTMPTKHFFTNYNTYKASERGIGQYGFIATPDPEKSVALNRKEAVRPFEFNAYANRNTLLVEVTPEIYNREEDQHNVRAGVDFSPSTIDNKAGISAEASLLNFSFRPEAKIFESINRSTVDAKYESGWATVKFANDKNVLQSGVFDMNLNEKGDAYVTPPTATGAFHLEGIPVIGIAATKYTNGNIGGGVLSNYMAIQNLAYKRNNFVVTEDVPATAAP